MEIFFNRLISAKKIWFLFGILLSAIIVIVGLVYLKTVKYKRRHHSYSVNVRHLPSEITIGSSINLFGLKVGKVERIAINKDYDGVDLQLSILEEVNDNLTSDTSLTVIPTLFGKPKLNLDPGKSSERLEDKDTIRIVVEDSIDLLIRKNLNPFYNEIIPAMRSGADNFSMIGERLNSVDFDKIAVVINEIALKAEKLLNNGNDLSLKAKTLLETYDKREKQLNTLSSDYIQFTDNLPHLLEKINKMLDDFSVISKAMKKHWLLKDPIKRTKKEIEEGEYFLE